MRERLVAALIGMTVAMIAIYAVPRAYLLAWTVESEEQVKIERNATMMAALLDERIDAGKEVDEEFLSRFLLAEGSIDYVSGDGERIHVGDPLEASMKLRQTRSLADGGSVLVGRSDEVIDQRISEALVPLVSIGLGLVVVSAFVGFFLARRLSRPFDELADIAERIAEADFDVEVPRYPIPEAEAIGSALRHASTQLDELLKREREFAANASHQLRTPITALRLTLEDLTMWPETPPSVADELTANIGELDRLGSAITELLELSRGRRLTEATTVDLTELARQAVHRWAPHMAGEDRATVLQSTAPVPAHVAPGPVLQVLDVLIENACAHGEGTVSLSTGHHEQYVGIVVADEGSSSIGNEVFQRGTQGEESEGHGLGLTIAAQLAASVGGRLTLLDTDTTTFALQLPAPPEEITT